MVEQEEINKLPSMEVRLDAMTKKAEYKVNKWMLKEKAAKDFDKAL